MKKLFNIILLSLTLICLGWQTDSSFNEVLIEKAIFSKEFSENFRICLKSENEIQVFNDTKENLEFTFSKKNNCYKTVTFSKINFEYNINSWPHKYKGIILYELTKNSDSYRVSFFDLENNRNLRLEYDKGQNLVNISSGSF